MSDSTKYCAPSCRTSICAIDSVLPILEIVDIHHQKSVGSDSLSIQYESTECTYVIDNAFFCCDNTILDRFGS